MKSTELRIKNLVQYKEIIVVENIMEDGINHSCKYEDPEYYFEKPEYNSEQAKIMEPIPITEEWLKKFGFITKDSPQDSHPFYELKTFPICVDRKDEEEQQEETEMYFYYENGGEPIIHPIKYVHQLQNLYFAITGEELIFKNNG